MKPLKNFVVKNILYIALLQAIVATLSSLYLSEVLHWNPCILCWYQRILMYPLVILIAVGILRKDKNLPFYILPMSVLGGLIALFHFLLQKGVIMEAVAPCSFGVSCLTKYTEWFGFITVPFLSMVAFAVISLCMYIYLKGFKK